MADTSALEARIRQVFRDQLKLEVPSADTDLFETAALDSMMFVDLLVHLEREFGVKVALEDIEFDHFRTIERIAQFVARRVAWAEGTTPRGGRETDPRGRAGAVQKLTGRGADPADLGGGVGRRTEAKRA